MVENEDLPYMSKGSNGGAIIALESHGYYLDVKQDYLGWSFKIDDWNTPKRSKITPWKTVDKPQKLETSRTTKQVREALNEILRYSYKDGLNRILHLLEINILEWEIPEDAEKPKPLRKPTIADQIVETVLKQEVQLFCDQFSNPYILIPTEYEQNGEGCETCEGITLSTKLSAIEYIDIVKEKKERSKEEPFTPFTPFTSKTTNRIYPLSSKLVKRYISGLIWDTFDFAPKTDYINSALLVLGGQAQSNGAISLFNRVAEDEDGNWWLDLTNDKWEAVKITDEGWSIETPPILFKRYAHQLPLYTPIKNGDVSHFLDYIHLHDVDNQLLWLVTKISYLIPGIPHIRSVLWGEKGSIKSTADLFLKILIDNSSVELLSLPSKHKPNDLIQQLDHHYISAYDNVSNIDDSQSDIFCRGITGLGQSKRQLYTDDQDFITRFRRCITQNGISINIGKPDLADRSIVQETKKIDKINRKEDKIIKADFINKAPSILGGFLDAIVKARNIKKTLEIKALNRMADFTLWGAAITEALGIDYNKFLIAYQQNINELERETVRSSVIGELLISYLKSVFNSEISSVSYTSTKLYRSLIAEAKLNQIDIKDQDFPKNPTSFGIALLNVMPNLPSIGYSIIKKHTREGNTFTFSKLTPTKLDESIKYTKTDKNVWREDDLRDILRKANPKVEEKSEIQPKPEKKEPITSSLRIEIDQVLDSLRKAQKFSEDGAVRDEDFVKFQEVEGNDPQLIKRIIDVLLRDGTIYRPLPGFLKTVEGG